MGKLADFFQGPNGEKSSKRLAGFLLVLLGAGLLTALGVYGFFAAPRSIEAVKYAGLTLVASGAGLLGFGTLAERMGK